MQTEAISPAQRGLFLPLLGAVGLLIICQALASWARSPETTPGEFRGDIVFSESILPADFGDWTLKEFAKPKAANERPTNQSFSSHTWRYQNPDGEVLVSCDQSNWHDWHELTFCYHQTGWKIKNRSARCDDERHSDWPYVVVELERDNTVAMLVFSMFFRDGTPLIPPDRSAEETLGTTGEGRWAGRKNGTWHSTHDDPDMLALQCQALFASSSKIRTHHRLKSIEFHLSTRQKLMQATINHPKPHDK